MIAPRVAIVGAGVMGRWHADAARRAGAIVAAVVDTRPGQAEAITGGAAPCRSLALALPHGIDVVHICTPLETHLELCRTALDAGCHVIVEKPVTPTRVEAASLVRAAADANRLLVPVHQFVFQQGIQRIIAKRDSIGPLRQIEFATCSAGAEKRAEHERDRVAAEIVPHAFAIARALLGRSVGDLDWQLRRPLPGEWRFTATTPEGCTLSGLVSLSSRPTFATCRVLGAHGSAMADLFHGFALFEPDTSSTSYKVMRPLAVGAGTVGAAAWHLAGRAVRRERAYPGLRTLCAAAYRAAMEGGAAPFRADEVVDVATARDRLVEIAAAHR